MTEPKTIDLMHALVASIKNNAPGAHPSHGREVREMIQVGDVVTFCDPIGLERPALVTAVHQGDDEPSLNVVFVSSDEAEHDSYGRQISRETSVVHKRAQPADGMFWTGRP